VLYLPFAIRDWRAKRVAAQTTAPGGSDASTTEPSGAAPQTG
jgi:hypothetical protein